MKKKIQEVFGGSTVVFTRINAACDRTSKHAFLCGYQLFGNDSGPEPDEKIVCDYVVKVRYAGRTSTAVRTRALDHPRCLGCEDTTRCRQGASSYGRLGGLATSRWTTSTRYSPRSS
jgi:hypothetical protein